MLRYLAGPYRVESGHYWLLCTFGNVAPNRARRCRSSRAHVHQPRFARRACGSSIVRFAITYALEASRFSLQVMAGRRFAGPGDRPPPRVGLLRFWVRPCGQNSQAHCDRSKFDRLIATLPASPWALRSLILIYVSTSSRLVAIVFTASGYCWELCCCVCRDCASKLVSGVLRYD